MIQPTDAPDLTPPGEPSAALSAALRSHRPSSPDALHAWLASALGIVASRFLEETASERRYRDKVLYGWSDQVCCDDDGEGGRGSVTSDE